MYENIFFNNMFMCGNGQQVTTDTLKDEMEIFAKLRRINGNKIVIVVSHRASTLRMMDKIYFLSNGRITESGTFDELYAKGGEFTVFFFAVHVYDDESARSFFFFDAFQKFVALPQNTRPRVGRSCSRFAVKARAFDGKGAARNDRERCVSDSFMVKLFRFITQ